MSPLYGIKAIVGLILIHLYLQKLSRRSQLRAYILSANHLIRSLMDNNPLSLSPPHVLSLSSLTKRQHGFLKNHIVEIDNRFNEVFPAFDSINPKFWPGNRIVDLFPNRFSFHLFNSSSDYSFKCYIQQLDALAIKSSFSPSDTLVITDASVKNNVTSSIVHIHIFNKLVVKTSTMLLMLLSLKPNFLP